MPHGCAHTRAIHHDNGRHSGLSGSSSASTAAAAALGGGGGSGISGPALLAEAGSGVLPRRHRRNRLPLPTATATIAGSTGSGGGGGGGGGGRRWQAQPFATSPARTTATTTLEDVERLAEELVLASGNSSSRSSAAGGRRLSVTQLLVTSPNRPAPLSSCESNKSSSAARPAARRHRGRYPRRLRGCEVTVTSSSSSLEDDAKSGAGDTETTAMADRKTQTKAIAHSSNTLLQGNSGASLSTGSFAMSFGSSTAATATAGTMSSVRCCSTGGGTPFVIRENIALTRSLSAPNGTADDTGGRQAEPRCAVHPTQLSVAPPHTQLQPCAESKRQPSTDSVDGDPHVAPCSGCTCGCSSTTVTSAVTSCEIEYSTVESARKAGEKGEEDEEEGHDNGPPRTPLHQVLGAVRSHHDSKGSALGATSPTSARESHHHHPPATTSASAVSCTCALSPPPCAQYPQHADPSQSNVVASNEKTASPAAPLSSPGPKMSYVAAALNGKRLPASRGMRCNGAGLQRTNLFIALPRTPVPPTNNYDGDECEECADGEQLYGYPQYARSAPCGGNGTGEPSSQPNAERSVDGGIAGGFLAATQPPPFITTQQQQLSGADGVDRSGGRRREDGSVQQTVSTAVAGTAAPHRHRAPPKGLPALSCPACCPVCGVGFGVRCDCPGRPPSTLGTALHDDDDENNGRDGARRQPTAAAAPPPSSTRPYGLTTHGFSSHPSEGVNPAQKKQSMAASPLTTAASFSSPSSSSPLFARDTFSAVEVIPGLYLGGCADATNVEALRRRHISLVVNVAAECDVTPQLAHNAHHIRYVHFSLRDHSDEAIAPFFSPVSSLVHDQLHRRQIFLERCRGQSTPAAGAAGAGGVSASHSGLLHTQLSPSHRLFAASTSMLAPPSEHTLRMMDAAQEAQRFAPLVSPACGGGGVVASEHAASPLVLPTTTAAVDSPMEEVYARLANTDTVVDEALQAWQEESENPWVAAPSVGGQPVLKEGRHETPRSPTPRGSVAGGSSYAAAGTAAASHGGGKAGPAVWGGTASSPHIATSSPRSEISCVSLSPSPLPSRVATFGACAVAHPVPTKPVAGLTAVEGATPHDTTSGSPFTATAATMTFAAVLPESGGSPPTSHPVDDIACKAVRREKEEEEEEEKRVRNRHRRPPAFLVASGSEEEDTAGCATSPSLAEEPTATTATTGVVVKGAPSTNSDGAAVHAADPWPSVIHSAPSRSLHPPSSASDAGSAGAAASGAACSPSLRPRPSALWSSPKVDPRDCGGVLIHCRMGVSRSASFVLAYLILYGTHLAKLEDTASLFVDFPAQEQALVHSVGGQAVWQKEEGEEEEGEAGSTNTTGPSQQQQQKESSSKRDGVPPTFTASSDDTSAREPRASSSSPSHTALTSNEEKEENEENKDDEFTEVKESVLRARIALLEAEEEREELCEETGLIEGVPVLADNNELGEGEEEEEGEADVGADGGASAPHPSLSTPRPSDLLSGGMLPFASSPPAASASSLPPPATPRLEAATHCRPCFKLRQQLQEQRRHARLVARGGHMSASSKAAMGAMRAAASMMSGGSGCVGSPSMTFSSPASATATGMPPPPPLPLSVAAASVFTTPPPSLRGGVPVPHGSECGGPLGGWARGEMTSAAAAAAVIEFAHTNGSASTAGWPGGHANSGVPLSSTFSASTVSVPQTPSVLMATDTTRNTTAAVATASASPLASSAASLTVRVGGSASVSSSKPTLSTTVAPPPPPPPPPPPQTPSIAPTATSFANAPSPSPGPAQAFSPLYVAQPSNHTLRSPTGSEPACTAHSVTAMATAAVVSSVSFTTSSAVNSSGSGGGTMYLSPSARYAPVGVPTMPNGRRGSGAMMMMSTSGGSSISSPVSGHAAAASSLSPSSSSSMTTTTTTGVVRSPNRNAPQPVIVPVTHPVGVSPPTTTTSAPGVLLHHEMSEDDATSAAAMGGNVLTPYGATLTAPVGLGGGRCVSPRFSRCSSTNSSLISFPGTAGMGGGLGLNAMTHGCPGMTYREAFDYLKQRKTDVNPNIGFVLALRELAGGVDFNLSTSV